MRITRTNLYLSLLLVVQLALAAVVYLGSRAAPIQSRGAPLLADFSADQVTHIAIQDGDGARVVLAKDEAGDWVMPEQGDYPVQGFQVTAFLDRLTDLDTGRLIAQNSASHGRLKVAADDYERLIELTRDGRTDRIYVGVTSGTSASHVRLNDQEQVYLVRGMTSSDVSVRPTSWVDAQYLSLPSDEIYQVTLTNANGTFEFVRDPEAAEALQAASDWTLVGLAESEALSSGSIDRLVSQLSSLRLEAPLGTEEQEAYGMDEPGATITLVRRDPVEATPTPEAGIESMGPLMSTLPYEETTYTVIIGGSLVDGGYVVKSSDSDYYVRLTASVATTFTDLTRAELLSTPEATPEPTAVSTPEVDFTPEPTGAATPDATAEVTAAETPAATAAPLETPTAEAAPEATAEATPVPTAEPAF